jgi:hypothetical protein
MEEIKFPALNETACRIRRVTNYCEMQSVCGLRMNLDTRLPCSVNHSKPRNASIIQLLEMVSDGFDGLYPGMPEDDFNKMLSDARETLDCVRLMAAEISGKIGIGL